MSKSWIGLRPPSAIFDVSRTVNFEGNISESFLRFQKSTVGLALHCELDAGKM